MAKREDTLRKIKSLLSKEGAAGKPLEPVSIPEAAKESGADTVSCVSAMDAKVYC